MKKVNIYVDGACSGNPGPGGFGIILEFNGIEKEHSGGEPDTTNNRMELKAAIEGLKALKEPCFVTLYSDSGYLVNAVREGWVYKWRNNEWMRNSREKAQNTDLWEELLGLLSVHTVEFIWVKGHAENEYNNRCDALAVREAKKFEKISSKQG